MHYFEYASNYCYEGEQHDFWEFLYVDKGELHVRAGSRELTMKRGQVIFHEPGEFHSLRANGVVAPNLVVMSFVCRSPAMARFAGRVLAIGDAEREYLARIIKEAAEAFSTPLNDPYTKQLLRAPHAPFGAEQLIGASLEKPAGVLGAPGPGRRGAGHGKAHQPDTRAQPAGICGQGARLPGKEHFAQTDAGRHLPRQPGGPQLFAKSVPRKDGRRRHGVFRQHENRKSAGAHPRGAAQFHRDIGAFGLHLHPLFLASLQKGDGHDALGICLQREGAGRAPQRPLKESGLLHKKARSANNNPNIV